MVNDTVPRDSPFYGFAFPGYYLIDAEGVVTAKFFQDLNADRTTSASILIREFGADPDNRQGTAETNHLTLTWSASNAALRPGQRAALVLDVRPKPGMHIYAPGDHRYLAIDWRMSGVDGAELLEPTYPAAEMMHLEAIDETVPVYYDAIRVVRDIHLLGSRELPDVLKGRDEIEVRGTFDYQACDARKCYPPSSIPLEWTFELQPHDLVRVPEMMRRDAARQ